MAMSEANTLPATMRLAATPGSAVETDLDVAAFDRQSSRDPDKIRIRSKTMAAFDENGDGLLDEKEITHLIEQKNQGDRTIAHMKTQGMILIATLVLFFAVTIGTTTYSVHKSTEDAAAVSGSNELVSKDGATIVLTAIATEAAPLYLIPVLPADVLLKMESITMAVKDSIYKGTGQIIPNSSYTFKISSFIQINGTFAVLSSDTGDELAILNGMAALKFGDTSAMAGTYTICSASVACARARVDGIDVPAYTAAADAALATLGISLNADSMGIANSTGPVNSTGIARERRYNINLNRNNKQCLPEGYKWPAHCNPPHGPLGGIGYGGCYPVRIQKLKKHTTYTNQVKSASDEAFAQVTAVAQYLKSMSGGVTERQCEIGLFEQPFSEALSKTAIFQDMTISISIFGGVAFAGVQASCGVTLHFGEGGQRACTSNNALGLSQEFVGYGATASITLSPGRLGGFGNVGSLKDDFLTASSVNFGHKNMGLSLTLVHNMKEWYTNFEDYKVRGIGKDQAKNTLVDFAGVLGSAKAIGVGFSYGPGAGISSSGPVPVSFDTDYIIEEQVLYCWGMKGRRGSTCQSKLDQFPHTDSFACSTLGVLKELGKQLQAARRQDRTGMTSWIASLLNL